MLRTERLEKEKTSRTIRDDGIKKDIDLIRNLIGEMSTHCASFRPNYYEEKMKEPLDNTEHLLYYKTGLIDRKVWGESNKQGFVADIHTLHLEKYYDFIPLYNQCYSYAMKLVKEKKTKTEKAKKFLRAFEKFRKTYGEVQEIIFVYLSYILECYSKTALAPMKLEIPRITRTLIYKLIDYGVLKPFELLDSLSGLKGDLAKELGKEEITRELAVLKKQTHTKAKSPKRIQELKEQIRIIEKLIRTLEKSKVESESKDRESIGSKLIVASKNQFEEKIALKEDWKKTVPDLRGAPAKSQKHFKIYAFRNIGEIAWKEAFIKNHPHLKEGTENFKDQYRKHLENEKIPKYKAKFLQENPKLKDEFKKARPDLREEFKDKEPDLIEDTEEFEKKFEEFREKKLEILKNSFQKKFLNYKEGTAESNNAFTEYVEAQPEFKQKFDEFIEQKMIEETHFEELEMVEKWVTMKFKEKIEYWKLTADDLDAIVNYIYGKDKIPNFFRHVQDDFQKTYLKLKASIKKLEFKDIPAMQEDTDVKEVKVTLGNICKTENGDKPDKDKKAKADPFRLDIQEKHETSEK